MEFKKRRFFQLLLERKAYLDNNGLLQNFNDSELLRLFSLLADYNAWKSKNEYIRILDNFVQNKIDFIEFEKQFSNLQVSKFGSHIDLKNNLDKIISTDFEINDIDIEYNSKSSGFTNLLSDLESLIEIYDPEISFEKNVKFPEQILDGLSEEALKDQIEYIILPELKKY